MRALVQPTKDFHVVGEADNRNSTLRLLSDLSPDVVLFHLDEDVNGSLETIKMILKDRPNIKIVAISIHGEGAIVENTLRAGVRGYLCEGEPSADVIEALNTVARGEVYVSPIAAARIVDWIRSAKHKLNPAQGRLTERELQVLRMLAAGKTTKEVASALNLGVQTVRSYRKTVMKKLNIHNISELIKFALAANVIHRQNPDGGNPDGKR